MFRSRVFIRVAAAALVACLAVGCNLRGFRVQLRGFDENQIRGLWLWREAPSGEFERHLQIVFGALQEFNGTEFLPYSMELNGESVTLSSQVERAEGAPDDLNVILTFGRAIPGAYKVSSYNAAGESSLSDGTLNY